MIDCTVCDGDLVVAVGTNQQTDLVDCPVCVGLYRDALFDSEIADVERMCEEAGVVPKWLPGGSKVRS